CPGAAAGRRRPGLWHEAVSALQQELGDAGPPQARRMSAVLPAGLTERAAAIRSMVARRVSRRQIGDELVISQHTVRHHLEHIYAKVGVARASQPRSLRPSTTSSANLAAASRLALTPWLTRGITART